MKNLKILYDLLIKWKWQFLLSSVLLIIGMFFRALEPLVFQVLIDSLLPSLQAKATIIPKDSSPFVHFILQLLPSAEKNSSIWVYLSLGGIIYFCIAALRGFVVFVAKAINASVTEKAIKKWRNKIFRHIQKLPISYFSEAKTGELTQRATGDIDTIRNFISTQLIEVIRLTAIFIFSFLMIYVENKTFAFISISLVPITAIAAYFFFQKEQKIWQLHEDESDKLNNLTQENLNGIRVVQAFANEQFEIEKFEKQNRAKLNIALKHANLHTLYWPLSDMVVNAQIFLSVLVGAWFTLNQEITLGQFMAFNAYVVMVAFPLRQVSRLLSQMGIALVAVERIQEILDAPKEKVNGKILQQKIKGKIEFRNVSFRYAKDEDFVLKNISFTINAGENIMLIGPTGAGKSTIIKLLLRFYEPTNGTIFIDDMPLNEIHKESIREKIGVVLQKAFLFSDTIGNNIAYANENKLNLLETANLSGLSYIDTTFNKGFDTVVGEKGVALSGGQKQRVALARTLLSQPEILVLDDVTSAVDTITEKEILNNLKQIATKRTTINISHRMSSLAFADKVMVLENGTISGFGTMEFLSKNNKHFQEILAIQQSIKN